MLGLVAAVVAPELYTGTFSDPATFLRVAAVVVGLVLWSAAMRRWVRPQWLSTGLVVLPILAVTAFAVWPYLRSPTEVNEAFPPTAVTDPQGQGVGATSQTSSPQPPTTNTTNTTEQPVTATEQPVTTTEQPTTTAPPAPVELRRGSFQGLTGHRGSGDAAVYRLEDSSILLRFEDVDIGSGPVLVVYLVPGADQRGIGEGVRVAPLKAERGNQNYTVPEGVDLTSGTWTVLVWCETFVVEVANATLAA